MVLTRKKLPIGIQNLSEIISEGQYYVDKTPLVWQLIQENKYFFLSRPRRFGKSLLVDTIKELFEANQGLFKDLYVHDKWDWSIRFPVLQISFSDGGLESRADLVRLQGLFQAFFFAGSPDRSIPYNWHVNNSIGNYEGYYASVFYAYFAAAGLHVRVEDATSLGRVDMAVLLPGRVVLFEFKVVEQGAQGEALQQIKAKHYADKYRAECGQIYMVGVEFSKVTRNVVGFEVALA